MIVSVIEIDNLAISNMSIQFSLNSKASSDFTTVVSKYTVPHNKVKSITTGSFPALYIKLQLHKGTPIGMKGLRIYGCDAEQPQGQLEIQSQGINIGVQSYLIISDTGRGLL